MINIIIIFLSFWACWLLAIAWISAFNWLVAERVFPRDGSVWTYIRTFLTTPAVITTILAEGVTKKILNRFCKE